jgi:uncharacterized RDD family membrane protein YckC
MTDPQNPSEPNQPPQSPYDMPQYPGGNQPPPPPPGYGAPPNQYGAQPPYGAPPQYPYGAPPPYGAPGYSPSGQLATWGYRVGGFVLDWLIFYVPAGLIGLATGSQAVRTLLSVIAFLIVGYLNGATGQTPGKKIVGLRLVRERDGQLLGGGMGIVRGIAHLLDSLSCLIGWLWPLWDKKRQTFADKICGTVVLRT